MSEVKYNDLSDGVARIFRVAGPAGAGGELVAFTPYQFDDKQTDQWTMNVVDQMTGQPAQLKLSKTMKRAVDGILPQLSAGASFSLTKNGRRVDAQFLGQSGGQVAGGVAPPAQAPGGPPPQDPAAYAGGPQYAKNGGRSTVDPENRYDKYSSPILSRSRMEAMADWAATETGVVVGMLYEGDPADEAVAKIYSTHLIFAQTCGMPSEFGVDRADLVSLLNSEIRKFGVDGHDVARFICESEGVEDTTQLSDARLKVICDDIPTFMESFAAWLAKENAPAGAIS